MTRRTMYPLALFAVICFILASCSFGNPSGQTALSALPADASNAQSNNIKLKVDIDTSIPYNTVGQVMNFTFTVKNNGNTSVPGPVAVSGAAIACPEVKTVGNGNDSLDPDEKVVCTLAYPLTQGDLDKGSVVLITTATVGNVNSESVTTTVPVVQPRAVSLAVTANPNAYNQVGQQIVFTYTITNSGTLSLGPAQFTVTDNLVSATPINCGDANTSLTPNATVKCTDTYTINQNDMNSVSVTSVAAASGGGAGASAPVNTVVNKGTPQTNPGNLTPGSNIQYTVQDGDWIWQIARCYGVDPQSVVDANKQIPNPAEIKKGTVLTIPNIGSKGTLYGPPCVVIYTVKSGDTWTSIAQQYNADETVMKMANKNSMPVGSDIKVPRNSAGANSSPSSPTKALSLTITANATSYSQVNQQITYTYTIKNTGNASIGPAQFTVTDSLIGSTAINCGAANTTLASNATVICNATYTVNQNDMNSVSITNTATASGGGVSTSQAAKFTLNKSVSALTLTVTPNPNTYDHVDQQITYTYTIQNTGTSTLGPAQFTVSDSLINATPFNCGNPNITLAPNATVTCTGTYTIKQADMTSVSITGNATASGGGVTSQPAKSTITLAVKSLTLTVMANPLTYNQIGQQITFTYIIKNTGSTPLGPAQFTVTDGLVSQTPLNCDNANITLAPNATVTCTGTHTVTDGDMASTSITSIPTASGAGLGPVTSSNFATVTRQ